MKFRISAKTQFFLLCTLLLTALAALPALAQPNTLAYGDRVTGALSAAAPSAFYSFDGTAGDLVALRAVSLSPDLQVSLTVLSASGPLAFSTSDAATPTVGDSSLTLRLAQSGSFQIFVGSVTGAEGNFAVLLDKIDTSAPTPLPLDQVVEVAFAPGSLAQAYSLTTSGANPTTLIINNVSSDFLFTAWVFDAEGILVAALTSADIQNGALTFALTDGSYEVVIVPLDSQAQGIVTLSVAPQAAVQPVAPPAATAPSGSAPAGVCSVTPANNAVNVRSAPTENASIIGSLPVGTFAPADARTESGWYRITLNGQQGWVAGFVVVTNGDCSALPYVDAPPPSATEDVSGQGGQVTQAPPTATEQGNQQTAPTATQEQQQQATEPPPPPTATTAVQEAPADANFNAPLDVPLDGTAFSSDFVSFPTGDTEDRVRYSVTGLNPNVALPGGAANLQIIASCTGTGTENIEFFTGGRTYGCGDIVFQQLVSFDSNTGTITIRAIGGSATYVQWTLTASAPRR